MSVSDIRKYELFQRNVLRKKKLGFLSRVYISKICNEKEDKMKS